MNVNAVGCRPRDRAEFERRLGTMVARYRTECLWDLKASPDLEQEQVARMVLRRVISCADRDGYIEARGTSGVALTDFQRTVCRLLADHRKREGVSYVAGALALNLLLDDVIPGAHGRGAR